MKLATFSGPDGSERFGAVLDGRVVPFAALKLRGGRSGAVPGPAGSDALDGIEGYLRSLPVARAAAEALLRTIPNDELVRVGLPLDGLRILPPVPRPAAILDCGLTPRHLGNASAVLLRRSLPPLLGALAGSVARRLLGRRPGRVRYYKGNCQSVSGTGDTIAWPPFTAYLDIEPELAFVTGAVPLGADRATALAAIAGYTILNDASARDVQLGEMFFTGPASSKDLDQGNGLGPWLVTSDELGDPRSLAVTVEATGRAPWRGTTAEYSMDPVDVLVALAERQSLSSGTVVGMGTVPDTCGLDRDEWLRPGDEVAITFEGIGTLRQRLGVPPAMPSTRWAPRHDLGPAR